VTLETIFSLYKGRAVVWEKGFGEEGNGRQISDRGLDFTDMDDRQQLAAETW
jgi:hypothetical protein